MAEYLPDDLDPMLAELAERATLVHRTLLARRLLLSQADQLEQQPRRVSQLILVRLAERELTLQEALSHQRGLLDRLDATEQLLSLAEASRQATVLRPAQEID